MDSQLFVGEGQVGNRATHAIIGLSIFVCVATFFIGAGAGSIAVSVLRGRPPLCQAQTAPDVPAAAAAPAPARPHPRKASPAAVKKDER